MRAIKTTGAFKKDYKRVQKRGHSKEKLEYLLSLLVTDESLPTSTRPHKLTGNYAHCWKCHIEPDWLLIYEFVDDDLLVLRRTGWYYAVQEVMQTCFSEAKTESSSIIMYIQYGIRF